MQSGYRENVFPAGKKLSLLKMGEPVFPYDPLSVGLEERKGAVFHLMILVADLTVEFRDSLAVVEKNVFLGDVKFLEIFGFLPKDVEEVCSANFEYDACSGCFG
jgi:hypothetical protein